MSKIKRKLRPLSWIILKVGLMLNFKLFDFFRLMFRTIHNCRQTPRSSTEEKLMRLSRRLLGRMKHFGTNHIVRQIEFLKDRLEYFVKFVKYLFTLSSAFFFVRLMRCEYTWTQYLFSLEIVCIWYRHFAYNSCFSFLSYMLRFFLAVFFFLWINRYYLLVFIMTMSNILPLFSFCINFEYTILNLS